MINETSTLIYQADEGNLKNDYKIQILDESQSPYPKYVEIKY